MENNKRSVLYKFYKPVRNREMPANIKKSKSFLYSFNVLEPKFNLATAEIKINRKCSEPSFYNENDKEKEKERDGDKRKYRPMKSLKDKTIRHKMSYVISIPSSPNKSMDISFANHSKSRYGKAIEKQPKNEKLIGISFPSISKKIPIASTSSKGRQLSLDFRLKLLSQLIHKNNDHKQSVKEIYHTNGITQRSNHHAIRKGEIPLLNISSIFNRLSVDRSECIRLYPTLKIKEYNAFSYSKGIIVIGAEVEL